MIAFEEWLGPGHEKWWLMEFRHGFTERDKMIARLAWDFNGEQQTTAERERLRYISQFWLNDLEWCIERMDMDSALDDKAFTVERKLFRTIRNKISMVRKAIWDETEEADDEPGRLDFSCDEEWEAYRKNRTNETGCPHELPKGCCAICAGERNQTPGGKDD